MLQNMSWDEDKFYFLIICFYIYEYDDLVQLMFLCFTL